VLAAVGGLVLGHIAWLVAISLATDSGAVNTWVLVVAAVSLAAGGVAGWRGWRLYRRRALVRAALIWALPVSPVLFSLAVLGLTYL